MTETILGLNAFHGDSAACLVVDGKLVAAAEEERFRRLKHWAGFPSEAVKYCLSSAGMSLADVDHVAVNRDPGANLLAKVLFSLSKRPSFEAIKGRLANASKVRDVGALLREKAGDGKPARFKVHNVEHHRAHMASSFYVSPFETAAVVSVDGFGDFVSGMWGSGKGTSISIDDEVTFPHSLGLFYLAMTQYLGFPYYGDEYKVMGLAPYGEPELLDEMRSIVRLKPDGKYGPDLTTPAVQTFGIRGGIVRVRSSFAIQSHYNSLWLLSYSQSSGGIERNVVVRVSGAYQASINASQFGNNMPDFSIVPGWQATWGLQNNVLISWSVTGYGISTGSALGQPVLDGTTILSATKYGSYTPP